MTDKELDAIDDVINDMNSTPASIKVASNALIAELRAVRNSTVYTKIASSRTSKHRAKSMGFKAWEL